MPISVVCTGCQKKLKAPDSAAGKRTKCPACQSVIEIPAPGASSGKDSWTVKIASGDDFGPVTKAELDQWLKEGRLDDQCQVLQEGAPQWQWASDLYPELAAAGNQPGQGAAVDPFGQPAVDPFGQAAAMQPQPMGMQPGGYSAAPSSSAQAFPTQTPAFQTNTPAGNPYGASSAVVRTQRGPGNAEAGIITIAVFSFVLSALQFLGGFCLAYVALRGAELASAFGVLGMVGDAIAIVIFVAILVIGYGAALLLGGVGILKHQQWGRIVALVCAGLAGVGALLQIFAVINGSWASIIGFLMYGGYCVAAFIVLLSSGANRAFAKQR